MFLLYRLKLFVADKLYRFPAIKEFLRRVYASLCIDSTAEKALIRQLGNTEDVFFVQVGSNDGKTDDPLQKIVKNHRSWHGIFVEPLPHAFVKLKENYNYEDRFVFENIAVSNQNGMRDFYFLEDSVVAHLPHVHECWPRVGSFSKEHVIKNLGREIEPYISHTQIECVSFSTLVARHCVQQIDLLHIDTEGYDYEIIKQINFSQLAPKIILFEQRHLGKEDKLQAYLLLARNGYRIKPIGYDSFAVLESQTPKNTLERIAKIAVQLSRSQ